MDQFLARQPIFDRHQRVVAYEILFRSGVENAFTGSDDPDAATNTVITNTLLLFGIKDLTYGKKAFINFTRNLLLSDLVNVVPKDVVCVEVLEDVVPDSEIIRSCLTLKKRGVSLALDDYIGQAHMGSLLGLADIIKVDFLGSSEEVQRQIIESHAVGNRKLLAEKVETDEDFQRAKELGYSLFQGYFFSKPVIISRKEIPGTKFIYLMLLELVNKAALDFDAMEEIIKKDASLSYKLLRYINSAFFSLPHEVSSIHHALVFMGENDVRKWISLIAISKVGEDKPTELMRMALTRARFAETVAPLCGMEKRAGDLFLLGLLSLLDTMVGRPMEELLSDLPVDPEIKDALVGRESRIGDILDMAIMFETGSWASLPACLQRYSIQEEVLPALHVESTKWAGDSLSIGSG